MRRAGVLFEWPPPPAPCPLYFSKTGFHCVAPAQILTGIEGMCHSVLAAGSFSLRFSEVFLAPVNSDWHTVCEPVKVVG